MDFQQIRDFVNPAVAQATGLQEVENLAMPVPVAYVPVQLVIDGALSLTSENPVQNKVIAVAIQQLDGRITAIEGQFSEGVTEAVNNWLAAHPEATTTVQDGAITYAKLDTNLKGEVDQISELKSAIQKRTEFIGYEEELYNPEYAVGSVKYSDGTFNTSSSYNDCKHSDFIPVKTGWSINYSARNATGNCLIAFYNTGKTYVQSESVEGTSGLKTGVYTVPADGYIIIACRADISTHTYVLKVDGMLFDTAEIADATKIRVDNIDFEVTNAHPEIIILTGQDFEIGTHANPNETRRIKLKDDRISKAGSIFVQVPTGNTNGYEVEIMNNGARVGAALNAWTFDNKTFGIVYAGKQYSTYNLYLKKNDNSDWSESDISNVKIIITDGGKNTQPVKLRIMSHNVGHYNYGNTGGYSGSDYIAQAQNWRTMLAKESPDIILVQEYNSPDGRFDSGNNINAKEYLYTPIFKGFYTNATGGQGVATIVTKTAIQGTWNITVSAGDTRKFACAVINIGGTPIVLCSAHLIPGTDSTSIANRESQRDQLITALSEFENVIIGGDFNAPQDGFYDAFVSAGYTLCNHGYFGNIQTQADGAIDNIIIKGLLPYNATASENNAVTSDHYPLISDVHVV